MLSRISPPIRIHIWGGLGSQLYAWALYIDLLERFPRRKLQLVFHNGGVTKRNPEIAQFFKKDEVKAVLDFSNSKNGSKSSSVKFSLRRTGKKLVVRILTWSGFVSNCDKGDSLAYLKPWVLEIRGHYSYRRIDYKTVLEIFSSMAKGSKLEPTSQFVGVHDRLGDLLSLDSKGPTPASEVISELRRAIEENPGLGIRVYSDSIIEATNRLKPIVNLAEIEYCDQDPKSTIIQLVGSQHFVGTSSKISIWVVIFRNCIEAEKINVMPMNLRENLISNIGTSKCISYY